MKTSNKYQSLFDERNYIDDSWTEDDDEILASFRRKIKDKAANAAKVANKAKKSKKKISEKCSKELDSIQENELEISNTSVQCLGTQENQLPIPNVDLSSDDLDSKITEQVSKAAAELEKETVVAKGPVTETTSVLGSNSETGQQTSNFDEVSQQVSLGTTTDCNEVSQQISVAEVGQQASSTISTAEKPNDPLNKPSSKPYDWTKKQSTVEEDDSEQPSNSDLNPPKPFEKEEDLAVNLKDRESLSDVSSHQDQSSRKNLSAGTIISRQEILIKDARIVFAKVFGKNRNFEDFKNFLVKYKLSFSMSQKNCTLLIRRMNNIVRDVESSDEEKRAAVLHAGTIRDLACQLEKDGARIDSSKLPPTKINKSRSKFSSRLRSLSGKNSLDSKSAAEITRNRRNSVASVQSKDQKADLIKDVLREGSSNKNLNINN